MVCYTVSLSLPTRTDMEVNQFEFSMTDRFLKINFALITGEKRVLNLLLLICEDLCFPFPNCC